MQEYEIRLPKSVDSPAAGSAIEAACTDAGLRCTMKGTLRSYPGSEHWHYKLGRQPGTLEVTLWPAQRRLWLSVQAGRTAEWIDPLVEPLREEIQQRLHAAVPRTD
jgi:hypothetical protein